MAEYSRRDFLMLGAVLAAGCGLARSSVSALANGLQQIFRQQRRILWLQGMACSGCSVSFLNSDDPEPLDILTDMIALVFHPTISAAQGEQALDVIRKATDAGGYYLVVEGAIPVGMPEACLIGDEPLATILPPILRRADAILAAGTCATFGGIPAAEGNSTGAVPVRTFMEQNGIPCDQRLVNCAGCPVHPQSVVATLAYLAGRGYPDVDPVLLTPNMFYKNSVHDDCPRFHYWQKQVFAQRFGEDGCLFKLGCLGPLSHTDCPRRQWNGGVNWCIRAGAPCLACTSEHFARLRRFSFYRKGEPHHPEDFDERQRLGDGA